MAGTCLSAHHLLHSHSEHSVHVKAWNPHVHSQIIHIGAPSCQPQRKGPALLRSSGFESCICSGPCNQQIPGLQPCSNQGACCNTNKHQVQALLQPQQQLHRNSNTCSAAVCGANWALAPGSTLATSHATPSLGWHAASAFFSKYSLGEVMGHGSFGTVHKAVHMQTGNSYAVKVLQKSCGRHGMQLDAIQREVATWQQAQSSRFVARLEGLFEDDDNAYIVQELCSGSTLREYLHANGTCTEQDAATIMQGVLDLLVECHRHQICYGDLKPANVMFSQQPLQVRAIDFGCSHNAKGRALTQTCGSPLYMAPEITQQCYGVAVDMWSAGVLLYQVLTGHLPFWPKKTLDEVAKLPGYEIMAAVRTYEVQFPSSLWGHISSEALDLVSRMLDRNPATRITATEALQHPWLCNTLGFTPAPSSDGMANNVVEFRVQHTCPVHPQQPSPASTPTTAGSPSAHRASAL